jgi:hypothetical protein
LKHKYKSWNYNTLMKNNNKTKKLLIIFFCMTVLTCWYMSDLCYALVPSVINFQGRLAGSDGVPKTGNFSITFDIYLNQTSVSSLWTETQTNVFVTNGIFTVLLGTVTPLGTAIFENTDNRWLEITVGSDKLSPRVRLVSVPFAYVTERAFGMIGTTITATNLVSDSGGLTKVTAGNMSVFGNNIGIGTGSPAAKLNILGTNVTDAAVLMTSHSVSGYGLIVATNGCVGVGTPSPVGSIATRKTLIISDTINGAVLELWGSISGKSFMRSVSGNTYMGNLAGFGYVFLNYGNNLTGMTIASNGWVGIGTTNPQANTHVNTWAYVDSALILDYAMATDSAGLMLYVGDGTTPRASYYYLDISVGAMRLIKKGSPDFVCASINSSAGWTAGCSRELKYDITLLSDDDYGQLCAQFDNIRLYSYRRIDEPQSPEVGFIAEETPEIAGSDGKGMNYMKSIGFLVGIIKGQGNTTNKQEIKIQNQENKVKELELRLQELELKYNNEQQ